MTHKAITRSEFLHKTSCLAAGAVLGSLSAPAAAQCQSPCQAGTAISPADQAAAGKTCPMAVRPYQLLCILCALGENDEGPRDSALKNILDAIRNAPDAPVTLRCNAGDVFVYQDPGTAGDSGSPEFNRKRDLEILQRLDMAPGETLPARIVLATLLKRISSVAGICDFGPVTAEAWKGCPKAASGNYQRGCKKGLNALIPPRDQAEMARDKAASMKVVTTAKEVKVRPHILLCSVCQYGSGARPPFKEDNLPELVDLMLNKRPDLSITLVQGADWMMCAPCPSRVVGLNACVCGPVKSGGLYNEMKDLNVLLRLGLTYGTTKNARELYRLILEKIPSVEGVCALPVDGKPPYSIWFDPCGNQTPKGYAKGREQLLAKLGLSAASTKQ